MCLIFFAKIGLANEKFIIFVAEKIYNFSLMELSEQNICQIDIAEKIASEQYGVVVELEIFENGTKMMVSGGLLMLISRGGESVVVDRKRYELTGYNLIVIPEHHIVEFSHAIARDDYHSLALPTDYLLSMPSPIDTNILNYSRFVSVIPISEFKYNDLRSYYTFIYKETFEESLYQQEIIQSLLYAMVLEVAAVYESHLQRDAATSIKADDLSDSFLRLLARHYRQHRTVAYYAEALNITPKYLAAAIKRITGRPILDWIHEAVLIDAKMLLRTTDLTVQEISERLNFSSPSAFVQFFRRKTGTTPKRHWRGEDN